MVPMNLSAPLAVEPFTQKRTMIRGIIFDFDGLILDTEGPEFAAWCEVYQDHGAELALAEWARCIGTAANVFDPPAHLATLLGRAVDRDRLHAAHRTRCDALIAAQVLRPGVEGWLRDARQRGFKLGVASSSGRVWVEGHLRRLGVLDQFDVLRCREDVAVVKPDPALYLAALAALGLRPEEAVALEDSPNGALAAKRAGLFCIAVPNALTGQLDLSHADLVVPSLAELSLAAVLDRVATRSAGSAAS